MSAGLVAVPPILPTVRAQLTETQLTLPLDFSEGEWWQTGRALGRMTTASMWWIGDWWNAGETRGYGDLKRASDETGIPRNTIRVAAWVGVQSVTRVTLLTWAHHRTVAARPDRVPWLTRAAEGTDGKPWTVRQLKDELRAADTRKRLADVGDDPDFTVIRGDFRDADVPAESVDWIITDPPYPAEFLPLYDALGEFANRVLRPGGSLVAMVGQSYLPAVLASLGHHLTYHWTLAYLTPGSNQQQWDRHVITLWKPLLWYVKGKYAGKWVADVTRSDATDKDYHVWGQSETGMTDIVERFTERGEHILDPFAGGMTTGIVAHRLGRRFTGIEIADG
jgi:hypothetical protein